MNAQPYGLFLDIQASQSVDSAERGIGRFVVEHARALVARTDLVRAVGMSCVLPFPGRLPAELLTSPLLTWNTATAFRHAGRKGPFAYHVMSPFEFSPPSESVLPPHAISSTSPLVVTLYDLIPLVMSDRYLRDPKKAALYEARLELVRNADLVLAISEHTRRDALRLLDLDPDRVVYIGGGVSPWFGSPSPSVDAGIQVRRSFPQIKRPFVLSVSGADDRKNTETLISAFAQLSTATRAAHQLVITCSLPPEFEARWRGHTRQEGLHDDEVIFTNYVSDPLLRSLYQAATLSVFPSLQEGFGFPVAEAIACGCPTISSSTSSLPEILDWAPSTFDPTDPNAITVAMERALGDRDFREQLRTVGLERARLHTWDAVAGRTAAALERLSPPSSRTSHRTERTLRIALVGPLPPIRSGIAEYNARLITELACQCELDIFSEVDASQATRAQFPGVRLFPTASLGELSNPGSYDAIVYTVGNSEHHHRTYELARRWPGIVWLHDVRFGGFYLSLGGERNPADLHNLINAKMTEQYGPRLPPGVLGGFNSDYEARFGLRLTVDWVRGARAVIVHSGFAEQMLKLDHGPNGHMPSVVTIPHAIPSFTNVDRIVRDVPPIIASFGFVSAIKFPIELIEALRLVREVVSARLVFVGPVELSFRHELERYATRLGVAEHLEFTGDVPDAVYQKWLWRATCAVQVRIPTNGEQSGAICDCVAAGLPVVTNLLGMDEGYEPDAMVRLAPYFSIDELAHRLTELLTEPTVWDRHHLAARRQAPLWTFKHVADRLLSVVAKLAATDST
jgi:glycosyltransferase involved in cell wall biosynthesis